MRSIIAYSAVSCKEYLLPVHFPAHYCKRIFFDRKTPEKKSMARFRALKQALETLLLPPVWPLESDTVPKETKIIAGPSAVGPLLAMLPRGGVRKWRAVILLGQVVANMAQADREKARTVMRRCMWHLNEDSGNLGWGIAEAMGEIVAQSPLLAREYGRVILSYLRDTGFADNYLDHAPLRRGAYWATARLAPEYVEYRQSGLKLLVQGLDDEDYSARGIAAWGIGRIVDKEVPSGKEREDLARLLRPELKNTELCEVLEGNRIRSEQTAAFTRQTLEKLALLDG